MKQGLKERKTEFCFSSSLSVDRLFDSLLFSKTLKGAFRPFSLMQNMAGVQGNQIREVRSCDF